MKATKTLKALGDNGFRAVYISVQTARFSHLIGEITPLKCLKIAPYWSEKRGEAPLMGAFTRFLGHKKARPAFD